jgi:hypothetical protein
MTGKKKYTLNVFNLLSRTDKGEGDFYDTLTEEQRKEFQPWLIQRWLSSRKLQLVNEITNPLVGSLPHELCWRLFCAIGIPRTGRYKFPTTGGSSSLKSDILLKLISEHFKVSRKVAKTYLPLLSKEDLLKIADEEGLEKDEIKKIKAKLG